MIKFKEVITANKEYSIINVLETINKEDIRFVPAVDKKLKLSGLIRKISLLSILSNQFVDMEVDVK